MFIQYLDFIIIHRQLPPVVFLINKILKNEFQVLLSFIHYSHMADPSHYHIQAFIRVGSSIYMNWITLLHRASDDSDE